MLRSVSYRLLTLKFKVSSTKFYEFKISKITTLEKFKYTRKETKQKYASPTRECLVCISLRLETAFSTYNERLSSSTAAFSSRLTVLRVSLDSIKNNQSYKRCRNKVNNTANVLQPRYNLLNNFPQEVSLYLFYGSIASHGYVAAVPPNVGQLKVSLIIWSSTSFPLSDISQHGALLSRNGRPFPGNKRKQRKECVTRFATSSLSLDSKSSHVVLNKLYSRRAFLRHIRCTSLYTCVCTHVTQRRIHVSEKPS